MGGANGQKKKKRKESAGRWTGSGQSHRQGQSFTSPLVRVEEGLWKSGGSSRPQVATHSANPISVSKIWSCPETC